MISIPDELAAKIQDHARDVQEQSLAMFNQELPDRLTLQENEALFRLLDLLEDNEIKIPASLQKTVDSLAEKLDKIDTFLDNVPEIDTDSLDQLMNDVENLDWCKLGVTRS